METKFTGVEPSGKPEDMDIVWIRRIKTPASFEGRPSEPRSIYRYRLPFFKKQLDDDGNHIFEECEPEFVPKKYIRPQDDDKKPTANKYANSELTLTQIQSVTKGKHAEIDQFAKENGVSLNSCKTKKEKLEKLEEAGVLY
jgi:hypothetical protein